MGKPETIWYRNSCPWSEFRNPRHSAFDQKTFVLRTISLKLFLFHSKPETETLSGLFWSATFDWKIVLGIKSIRLQWMLHLILILNKTLMTSFPKIHVSHEWKLNFFSEDQLDCQGKLLYEAGFEESLFSLELHEWNFL